MDWFEKHAKKHEKIMLKLIHLSDDEIIEYFTWDNMLQAEPDFCPLYKENKKCHDMEDLNCYLCACPNFRFNDDEPIVKSDCGIKSKDGVQREYSGIIHQDCSACTIPHGKWYVKKHFNRDWKVVMDKVASKKE